uniref:Secreted protein n=1 Tax=Ascaris lumbricoides TaxID=6252 RepID=A0A0M3HW53_ASCLU
MAPVISMTVLEARRFIQYECWLLRRLTTLSFCRSVLLPYKPHRSTAVFYSNLQYTCNYLAEYCNAESAAKFRKMCLIIAARTCPTAVASCDRPRFLFSSTELS